MFLKEEMETNAKRLRKYSGIALGIVLVTAFVLVQPTMQTSYAQVVDEGALAFDNCFFSPRDQPDDPLAMNTIRNKDVAKTVIAEKEIFRCETVQGDIPLIVDVTSFAEILENMTSKTIISKQAHVITCVKLDVRFHDLVYYKRAAGDGSVVGCDVYVPNTDFVPVSDCWEHTIAHPQEMNTVNKGKTVKTIVAQKEIFICLFDDREWPCMELCDTTSYGWFDDDDKKVEQYIIEEIWEDLRLAPGNTVVQQNVESLRCWTLITEAFVESCQFTTVQVQEFVPEE